ncbi:MAG: asparaginase [Bacteroidetes bacterium]|nr:asparaginase [Bacteroidota bacterium]
MNAGCNPVLVTHSRGGITESFHRGVVCVVDAKGQVLYQTGDIKQVCYPRSALKYFQHIPLITSGAFARFGFSLKDLALMCGSHNGESIHVAGARHILEKAGLSEDLLGCGAQAPTLKQDYIQLLKEGKEPMQVHNNCSGKHSGFLAWCAHNGASTSDYLSPEHPLHKEIRRITALFHEMDESDLVTGLDGCSAPIFAMPVYNQAIAYKNLLHPEKFGDPELTLACRMILEAVAAYPEMVAGHKRYCTDLMRVTRGRIIGKTGADGIYSLAIPEKGWGICIKVDDGRMGPQYNVAQQLLQSLGLISASEAEALKQWLVNENRNYAGNVTGQTVTTSVLEHIVLAK